jgi:hypothetical protein
LATVRHWLGELKSAVAGGEPRAAAHTLMEIVGGDCADVAGSSAVPRGAAVLTEQAVERQE